MVAVPMYDATAFDVVTGGTRSYSWGWQTGVQPQPSDS